MKRRFPAFILALVLCIGLAVPAFAADGDFIIENGVLTKYNGPGGSVVIPGSVTTIGDDAFWRCTRLTSVTIPNGVTEIGDSAFRECTKLTSVTIPNSVTTIGDYAFNCCFDLASVTIPNSVTTIGEYVFAGCFRLTSVTIPSSVSKISAGMFGTCHSLTSITIPSSVTQIDDRAFYGCTGLTSVTIPDSVTKIGDNAFTNCTNLTYVTIPNSVTEIGDWAFSDCLSIRGYESSAAQRHAKKYNIPFVSLGAAPTAGSFTDVKEGDWYGKAVTWAAASKIAQGTGNNKFSPGSNCTHEQILTFLYRAQNNVAATAGDMEKAVNWAKAQGMAGEGFDPKAFCTRADAVKYIWQAQGSEAPKGAARFTDVPAGADYAKAAAWAVELGIAEGTGGSSFSPDKVCNRGTIATFLYRTYVPEARVTAK